MGKKPKKKPSRSGRRTKRSQKKPLAEIVNEWDSEWTKALEEAFRGGEEQGWFNFRLWAQELASPVYKDGGPPSGFPKSGRRYRADIFIWRLALLALPVTCDYSYREELARRAVDARMRLEAGGKEETEYPRLRLPSILGDRAYDRLLAAEDSLSSDVENRRHKAVKTCLQANRDILTELCTSPRRRAAGSGRHAEAGDDSELSTKVTLGLLSYKALADKHGLPHDALRKRIDRFLKDYPNLPDVKREYKDRVSNGPVYSIKESAVLPVIEKMKRARRKRPS